MIISQLELGLPVIWFHFSPGSIYYQLIRTRFTRSPSELEFPFFQIYNGNWTEWSAVWAEIPNMSSDRNCMTRGSITTLLYPFRNRLNTRLGQFKYFIDALLSQFEIKFIQFLGGGRRGNIRVLETKVAKLPHDTLSLSFSLNKLWNLIGRFVLSVASSLAGKKMWFKAKNCDSWIFFHRISRYFQKQIFKNIRHMRSNTAQW